MMPEVGMPKGKALPKRTGQPAVYPLINLTIRVVMGNNIPYNDTERTMKTSDFLAFHNVFSLNEATQILAPTGGKAGTVGRLKHHLAAGRLKLVTLEIYAVVPPV